MQEIKETRGLISAEKVERCEWCGSSKHYSVGRCPRVKSLELFESGQIRRVEFFDKYQQP